MELADLNSELAPDSILSPESRSLLVIDLNETPCPSGETLACSAYNARCFTGAVRPLPAVDGGLCCGTCGLPEARDKVVVCDACERGFHLNCTGMPRYYAARLDEWICHQCKSSGAKPNCWRKATSPLPSCLEAKQNGAERFLDINALPPSDGETEGAEELQVSRKHIPGDNSFGGNPFGAPVTNGLFCAGNGSGFHSASGILTHAVKSGFEERLHCEKSRDKDFEEVNFGLLVHRLGPYNASTVRSHYENLSNMHLQALRKFIFEKHGVLEDGWHVGFTPSMNSHELRAIYCAPDGKTFDSVHDVACFLGLMSDINSTEPHVGNSVSALLHKKLQLFKRRKSARQSVADGCRKNKEASVCSYYKELLFKQHVQVEACEAGNGGKGPDSTPEENSAIGSQLNEGLPLQYEDFFVLSLGVIDTRSSYHDRNFVWPIGFRSCWHDKITGSLFLCYVADGGDGGPLFRVRRCSCSSLPIPMGSTVLFASNPAQSRGQNKGTAAVTYFDVDFHEEENFQEMFADPNPSVENDLMLCLRGSFSEVCDVPGSNRGHVEAPPTKSMLSSDLIVGDDIGDFSEEGHSSSLVWTVVSQKVVHACREVYKQRGSFKLLCKHFEHRAGSSCWDIMDAKAKRDIGSLAKFCSSSCNFLSPFVASYVKKLETISEELEQWLGQNRFGLDLEFVQEILEQLPGVHACTSYEFLSRRCSFSTPATVGNGHFLVKREGMELGRGEVALQALLKVFNKDGTQRITNSVMEDLSPPCGKLFGSKLRHEQVGDVLQVSELLWRFNEILDLKKPLSFVELEEELISPWSFALTVLDKLNMDIQERLESSLHGTPGKNKCAMVSSSDYNSPLSGSNLHAFMKMETGEMKEAAQARLASLTYSRCTGVSLARAHSSLLKQLVTELQSKVAALVDPNFDAGESKSRRGRKRDADATIIAKRTKLNILPINEFTWPEIARRYVLAILTLDTETDSSEITTRESGKVFRCLQGDGGVLCGSLAGVAGMEADAMLLAEATNRVFSSLQKENVVLTIEDKASDTIDACDKTATVAGNIPEWAQLLLPVRKLPTNVGTRIRKCVQNALEKDPPEWAKKILEHSISKEVYKGNASGPTKKAVLSLLDEGWSSGPQVKPVKAKKREIIVCPADILMKKCRIVLRRAAVADESKTFCNLLGSKLMTTSDNDDEGILGSPAMVSRPLDFRTIDLRLAYGAYGGSHEAFLEDVHELWSNVFAAYGDQPELIELAKTLSRNFKSLYDKEVLSLLQKITKYAKSGCLSAESKKEIDDILSLSSEIPKAPWDEGVCKVCGIDKDDDSVLLCDSCDAEYHTYCLNPPLTRIPKGNWYCPSCVAGVNVNQDGPNYAQVIGRYRRKKYQRDLDALTHLAAVMEEKEYWEFNADERIFLLKFLCDELLDSALVRQHLEHCAETSPELQQKLRSRITEWKNLKSREEILAAQAAKAETGMSDVVGMGKSEKPVNLGNNMGEIHTVRHRSYSFNALSDDILQRDGGQEVTWHTSANEDLSVNCPESYPARKNEILKALDSEDIAIVRNDLSCMDSDRSDESCRSTEQHSLKPLQQDMEDSSRNIGFPDDMQEKGAAFIPSSDIQGSDGSSELKNIHLVKHAPPSGNESQPCKLELDSVRNAISVVQESIYVVESQLLKQSLRREFLGSDSAGRRYWVFAKPDMHPWVVVDRNVALPNREEMTQFRRLADKSSISRISGDEETPLIACGTSDSLYNCSSWVFYESDSDIEELIGWLKVTDSDEKVLKDSLLQWQKQRLQGYQRGRKQDQDGHEITMSESTNNKDPSSLNVCRATSLLEEKYGPCFDFEASSRRQGKKAKLTSEGKLYRCECLEPVWPSRYHCLSCHRTFSTDFELTAHNDSGCGPCPLASEKSKENGDNLKGKDCTKADTFQEDNISEMVTVEASNLDNSEHGPGLTKFQTGGLGCPFDFEEIHKKFVTNDSLRELVQQVGLIGSNGIPSFISSVSPYAVESIRMVMPQHDASTRGDGSDNTERPACAQPGNVRDIAGRNASDNFSAGNEIGELLKTECPENGSQHKDERNGSSCCASEENRDARCVVPQSSLRPLVGKVSQILRHLKINLLDMDAALPREALRPSKACSEMRWMWRSFVKSAHTIYEMVQATIVFSDMIKADYLKNDWWYWSSQSAAAKISTLSSLALRVYSLDAAIIYEKTASAPVPGVKTSQRPAPSEKSKASKRANKRRREAEG